MLAPEKRHRVERLALPQHIARRGLALAFRHHPMLDPDFALRMGIGSVASPTLRIDGMTIAGE